MAFIDYRIYAFIGYRNINYAVIDMALTETFVHIM